MVLAFLQPIRFGAVDMRCYVEVSYLLLIHFWHGSRSRYHISRVFMVILQL